MSIVSDDGRQVFAAKTLSGLTPKWTKFEVTLATDKVAPTAKARFQITQDRPGPWTYHGAAGEDLFKFDHWQFSQRDLPVDKAAD